MIINGDCLEELDKLDENSVDAIITDPPYELNFMSKGWDNAGVSFNKETWKKCMRVLKPGGYMLAFGGTRTYHRIACAIEDAGLEIRDCIMWLYGSGFPKSMNIGLAIDKKNGVESEVIGERMQSGAKFKLTQELIDNGGFNDPNRKSFEIKKAQNEWAGWGTALKPSYEPIIVARKPFNGSCVGNVLEWGVGGINIDECRISHNEQPKYTNRKPKSGSVFNTDTSGYDNTQNHIASASENGRFPANTILTYDENDYEEVCGGFPQTKGTKTNSKLLDIRGNNYNNSHKNLDISYERGYDDSGSAARYFYCAKASKKDRDEGLEEFEKDTTDDGRNKPIDNPYLRGKTKRHNTHPTVKPTSLMQYLIRLVAPKGATILDPFMGSGSTGKAVMYENKERDAGYKFIGIEKDDEYCKIAEARIKNAEALTL